MFSLVDRLEHRLSGEVVKLLLNLELVVGAIEGSATIKKLSEGEFSVEARRLFGTRRLLVKASSDAGGGNIVCYEGGKPRWSYSVSWTSMPGSATAQISLEFRSADGGLKPKAKRLFEELRATLLNGNVEQHYTSILSYFKGETPEPQPAPAAATQRGQETAAERPKEAT